jgi:hypothetical protein
MAFTAKWNTHHFNFYVAFAGNVHIHPVVERLSTGPVLRQDERDIDGLLVLDGRVPVISRATVFDLVGTGRYVGLHVSEHGVVNPL